MFVDLFYFGIYYLNARKNQLKVFSNDKKLFCEKKAK